MFSCRLWRYVFPRRFTLARLFYYFSILALVFFCSFVFISFLRPNLHESIFVDNLTADPSASSACVLAKLDPNNVEVTQFLKNVGDTIKCADSNKESPMAYIKDGYVFIKEGTNAKCDIHYFVHEYDAYSLSDGTVTKVMPVEQGGTLLPSDYGFIKCQIGNLLTGTSWRAMYDEIRVDKKIVENAKSHSGKPPLNVLVISFDSTSHMHALRKLPKTMKYFTETMEGEILNGYNIVGDGTPQAFIPILTGETEEELPSVRKIEKEGVQLDNVYPMLWKEFKKNGYVTAFGEESPLTMIFSHRLRGFAKKPVDHYPIQYFVGAEDAKFNDKYCYDGRPQHEMWFRTIKQMFTRYPENVPKFVMMHHCLYSHDSSDDVQLIDNDLSAFFDWLTTSGVMNNTLLVFMADHGHRFAKLRATQQGMQEERLPLMGFAAPKQWRNTVGKTQWENLKTNVDRLTTPFDLHETLRDVLHWPPAKRDTGRAHSLWHEVPEERKCSDAGVDAHWCTCMPWTSVDATSAPVQSLSTAIVARINAETDHERAQCAPLHLDTVQSAKRQSVSADALKYAGVLDAHGYVPKLVDGAVRVNHVHYQLRLTTKPGNALYEATVKVSTTSGSWWTRYKSTSKITVDLTAISHVNKYGDQPHCVIDKDFFLAKWCVCRDRV